MLGSKIVLINFVYYKFHDSLDLKGTATLKSNEAEIQALNNHVICCKTVETLNQNQIWNKKIIAIPK